MELFDPTAMSLFIGVLTVVMVISSVVAIAVLGWTLRDTRRERIALHESIPAYYGRLHFAR